MTRPPLQYSCARFGPFPMVFRAAIRGHCRHPRQKDDHVHDLSAFPPRRGPYFCLDFVSTLFEASCAGTIGGDHF